MKPSETRFRLSHLPPRGFFASVSWTRNHWTQNSFSYFENRSRTHSRSSMCVLSSLLCKKAEMLIVWTLVRVEVAIRPGACFDYSVDVVQAVCVGFGCNIWGETPRLAVSRSVRARDSFDLCVPNYSLVFANHPSNYQCSIRTTPQSTPSPWIPHRPRPIHPHTTEK